MTNTTDNAAPDIQQEPIGYIDGHYGFVRTKEGINMQIGAKAYAFPPDAQAEITKRDERIKGLKNKAELPMKYKRMQFNAELQKEVAKQAAEIARLNAVIAKCACSLHTITKRANYLDVLDIAREANEALAAIKEEGL